MNKYNKDKTVTLGTIDSFIYAIAPDTKLKGKNKFNLLNDDIIEKGNKLMYVGKEIV